MHSNNNIQKLELRNLLQEQAYFDKVTNSQVLKSSYWIEKHLSECDTGSYIHVNKSMWMWSEWRPWTSLTIILWRKVSKARRRKLGSKWVACRTLGTRHEAQPLHRPYRSIKLSLYKLYVILCWKCEECSYGMLRESGERIPNSLFD